MKTIPILIVALALLSGCGAIASGKQKVYSFAADKGNKYCETRDPDLRDEVVARINAGLRDEGAVFTFNGVSCDADQE